MIRTLETRQKISQNNARYWLGKKKPVDVVERSRAGISGEKNYQWKGGDVGYRALHKWVEKMLGKPETCKMCGKSGLSGRQIHWANVSGEYKRSIDDWRRLCVKCHSAFDRSRDGN